jgi:hypothetical protein
METKYYTVGDRPVIQEIHETFDNFLAFQWKTGDFKQEMRYNHDINFDPSGDVEELSKEAFDNYVEKLKKEKGLT